MHMYSLTSNYTHTHTHRVKCYSIVLDTVLNFFNLTILWTSSHVSRPTSATSFLKSSKYSIYRFTTESNCYNIGHLQSSPTLCYYNSIEINNIITMSIQTFLIISLRWMSINKVTQSKSILVRTLSNFCSWRSWQFTYHQEWMRDYYQFCFWLS